MPGQVAIAKLSCDAIVHVAKVQDHKLHNARIFEVPGDSASQLLLFNHSAQSIVLAPRSRFSFLLADSGVCRQLRLRVCRARRSVPCSTEASLERSSRTCGGPLRRWSLRSSLLRGSSFTEPFFTFFQEVCQEFLCLQHQFHHKPTCCSHCWHSHTSFLHRMLC